MLSFRHRGVTLDYCVKCSGVWLDGDDVDRVLGLVTKKTDSKRSTVLGVFVLEAVGELIVGAVEGAIAGAVGALFSS